MLRASTASCSLVLAALVVTGCDGTLPGDWLAPQEPPLPSAPAEPPPTGNKWQGIQVTGDCGRTTLAYVLVDEVCGGTDDPAYMDYFHAPIMRDGVEIDGRLYTVDATSVWVLDVTQPDETSRHALLGGFGEPLAVGEHEGDLILAAGDEGLIVVDVTSDAPVRVGSVELAGPALDVWVDGDRAFVATGFGGVAVVDLSLGAPELVATLDAPGFAAAVAARDGVAYVAACDTFATIDVATGALLGQAWLSDAIQNDILVAPAKDITLVGDRAFVAAGRYGAVAMDITSPASPAPFGNCTVADDQSFYASGVRERNGKVYVAGGEYGILPVDVTSPSSACSSLVTPALPPPPSGEEACTTEAPWELVEWEDSWTPPSVPPEGRDPIQTLPLDTRVYAFGDATRIGLRAIDIRDPDALEVKIGRYSEPRLTEGIAAQNDAILVAGKKGGLFAVDPSGAVRLAAPIPQAALSRAAAFLGDGRWVLGGLDPSTGAGVVYVQGLAPQAFESPIWAGGLAAKASTIYVPTSTGVEARDITSGGSFFTSGHTAQLPQSIAVGENHLVVASPEWTSAVRVDGATVTDVDAIGVFATNDLANVSEWRKALPRRVVMTNDTGIIEVASLGGRAGITVHTDVGATSADLPAGDYIAATYGEGVVYAVAVDRGRYRSQLVTIDVSGGEPVVEGSVAFAGAATGLAIAGGHLVVADADRGLRNFDLSTGSPVLVQILELGDVP